MLILRGPCKTSRKQLKPPEDLTKRVSRSKVPPPLTNTLPVGKPLTTPLKPKPASGEWALEAAAALETGEAISPVESVLVVESGRSGFVFEHPTEARPVRTTTRANFIITKTPFVARAGS